MGLSNPIGSLKLREKPMLCFIDSSPGVWRQSGGWIFHFSLYVWTESCIPVFKVSLQTCPIADINKVIRWARRDSEGNSMLGDLEEPSDSTFCQFRLSCFIVLLGRWVLFDFKCYHRACTLTGGESCFVHVNENLCFAMRWYSTGFAYWRKINLNMCSKCKAL